ncbi:MAG: hypothetical protein HY924_13340 [Elusimicrobia bacterium]|nr:hypothetical protein [Elusimicrobiota bacterium]
MTPDRPRAAALLFAFLASVIAVKSYLDVDNDLFFHLVEGERIVTQGRMPLSEDLSFTAAGTPMVATEWLGQAVIHLVFRLAGYHGLVAFHTTPVTAALFLLWLTLEGAPYGARLFLLALTAMGLAGFYSVRIHYYTFLFFSAFLYWTRRWEDGASWAPWAMAGALLPWANTHGGFMAGWLVLAAVCGLDLWKSRSARSLLPLAVGTLACCLHPSGFKAFVYPVWFLFQAPPGRSLIMEWKPVDFTEKAALAWLAMIACLAWAGVGSVKTRFPWHLLTLGLLAEAVRGRKLIPLFLFAAAATLGLRSRAASLRPWQEKGLRAGGLATLLCLGWVVLARARSLPFPDPAAAWERGFPKAAVELVGRRYQGRRLFHTYGWGGYLIYKLSPATKVFIDGRLEPFWELLAKDYKTINEGGPGWRDLMKKHDIEVVLIQPTSMLAHLLAADPGWKPVYSDRMSILFSRADVAPSP